MLDEATDLECDDEAVYTQAELEDALAQMRDAAYLKGRAAERQSLLSHMRFALELNGSGAKMLRALEHLEPIGSRTPESPPPAAVAESLLAEPAIAQAPTPVPEKPTAAVDLDATLARYDGWKGADHFGDPLPGAREFLTQLQGTHRVLIFTTRTKADDPGLARDGESAEELAEHVAAWLDTHDLPFDAVYTGQGKPLAEIYIDDRAIAVPPNPTPADYTAALVAVQKRGELKSLTPTLTGEDDTIPTDPAPYGYCPTCRTPGIAAERRPNGNAHCAEGHVYPRAKAKYASTQVELTGPAAAKLRAMAASIPDSDLGEDGREDEPHITARYGLHADGPAEVAKIVTGFGPLTVHLGPLSAFRGAETGCDYDVIHATVESPDLVRLHDALGALPHTDTHPEYHPHATVAYVKAGLAEKYLALLGDVNESASLDALTFSTAKRDKTVIPLAQAVEKGLAPEEDFGTDGEGRDWFSPRAYALLKATHRAGLTRVLVVDKNGHRVHRWVRAGAATKTSPPPPPPPNPKALAQSAVAAVQTKLAAGHALSAQELADLPRHLALLTVPQIQAVKKTLGVKGVMGTATKKGHVAKLVAHAHALTAKATSPPPPPPPPPPPTKTQLKVAARTAGIAAATALTQKLRSGQALSAQELADFPKHLAAMTASDVQTIRAHLHVGKEKTKTAQIHSLVRYATRLSAPKPVPAPPPVAPPPPPSPPQPPPPSTPPTSTAAPAPAPAPAKPSLWSRIWGGTPAPAPTPVPAAPAASGKPSVPPTPLFTGVDSNGHHWVNGKQVAKPPEETHWETGKTQPGSLNGVDFKSAPPKFWEKTKDAPLNEPAPLKPINRVSVMIQEPDGRIWIVQPTNGYGNRKFTLAGGGVEKGLSDQQNALKEVWEETGLQVEITGHLGDFEDSNNGNNGRLYIGKRIGGAPWDAKIESFITSNKTGQPAAESEKVSLVTPEKAAELLHRTDDLAQLMTVAPIAVTTPTTGKGSEPLKKLLAGLQPKTKAYIAKQAAAGLKAGVPELHAVQEMRGFNKKPTVVSKQDMDALIAAGDHVELLRGVKSAWGGKGQITSEELADQFRTGDHFPGNGCFGSGTYADSTKGGANAASSYAGGGRAGHGGSSGGSVIRMALSKKARVIKQSELEKLAPKPPDSFTKAGSNLVHSDRDEWLGVQAALAGYDAIEVDGKSQRHGSYGKGYYVILNRGAVVVQKEDASGHQIK